jgi:hypothetical protein
MAKIKRTNQLPPITDLTGVSIIGLSDLGPFHNYEI